MRKHSIGVCGVAYGDEGKGRIVDDVVAGFAKHGPVVVYRDNGGSNAGHTIYHHGKKVALHQLLSGVFHPNATLILGKEMVLHPGDLVEELRVVDEIASGEATANVKIDEMALLCLDTHRAYEAVLKDWQSGSEGATGRGISPAYVDVLLRCPLRMKDLRDENEELIRKHYRMYQALIKGLDREIVGVEVPSLSGKVMIVGSEDEFVIRLNEQAKQINKYIQDVTEFLASAWENEKYSFVFEKGQAVGLDRRWGVYPDVTASDTTFDGILSSTEGIVDPDEIAVRAGVVKATYMSSVGVRRLPSVMDEELALRIRDDANEYGATTKRPRDIAYLDLPTLKYLVRVGRVSHLVLTHMDISYLDTPVKVCVEYTQDGKKVEYRPDQAYLDTVKPVYEELSAWDGSKLSDMRKREELPKEAEEFLQFVEKETGLPILSITTGPERDQGMTLMEIE